MKIEALSINELVTGFQYSSPDYKCVVCGKLYQEGRVYQSGKDLMQAKLAMEHHVETEHGGMLNVLLAIPQETSGITEIQSQVLKLLGERRNDAEIARKLGGRTASAIRNHRFQFKKRVQQAKILCAVWDLLDRSCDENMSFVEFHDTIPMADDRVITTKMEAEKILGRVFQDGRLLRLRRFPKKEKEKLVVLKRIAEEFDSGKIYTEREVNAVLEPIYSDYVTIRRYLIEYRFLTRNRDGSEYRVGDSR